MPETSEKLFSYSNTKEWPHAEIYEDETRSGMSEDTFDPDIEDFPETSDLDRETQKLLQEYEEKNRRIIERGARSPFTSYLLELDRYPLLSPEEERETGLTKDSLCRQWRAELLGNPLVQRMAYAEYAAVAQRTRSPNVSFKRTVKQAPDTAQLVRSGVEERFAEMTKLISCILDAAYQEPFSLRNIRGEVYERAIDRVRELMEEVPLELEWFVRGEGKPGMMSILEKTLEEMRSVDPREGEALIRRAGEAPESLADRLERVCAIHASWQETRHRLANGNLRLVVAIAKKFKGRGLAIPDLVSEGNTGLMKAVDKFDASRGYKFSTYATWWIQQSVMRGIDTTSRTISIPVYRMEMFRGITNFEREFANDHGRKPSDEEVAEGLNLDRGTIRDLRRGMKSLDSPIGNDGKLLGSFIPEHPLRKTEQRLCDIRQDLRTILLRIPLRSRRIISEEFGLGLEFGDDEATYVFHEEKYGRDKTLEEMRESVTDVQREGVSRERVRQIRARGAHQIHGYLQVFNDEYGSENGKEKNPFGDKRLGNDIEQLELHPRIIEALRSVGIQKIGDVVMRKRIAIQRVLWSNANYEVLANALGRCGIDWDTQRSQALDQWRKMFEKGKIPILGRKRNQWGGSVERDRTA